MGQFPQAKTNERIKAFELFCEANAAGQRRSLRSIAQELGVHQVTVQGWATKDEWQTKLQRMLDQSANTTETLSQAIKRRVRSGMLDGLDELKRLAIGAKRDSDRIAATKALADIAMRMEAIAAGAGGGGKNEDLPQFQDDLAEEPSCPPATSEAILTSERGRSTETTSPPSSTEPTDKPVE